MTLYWRKNRRITVFLLLVWGLATMLVCLFAPELNRFSFVGFPLGFYFAAQGVLVLYLVIVGVYALYMNRLDAETLAGNDEPDLPKR